MQDKSYAIAIVVVLGICCLGAYVAISGFLNSNPSALTFSTPVLQATSIAINLPTDTPAPTIPAAVQTIRPTSVPVPSPLGAFQTITAAATIVIPPTPPTLTRTATPAASSPAAQSCAGFPFCWKYGVPDAILGPTGNECPRNYIWGLVTDANGKGLPNVRIRHQAPNGEYGETLTKDKPDVPGKYDILAPSGTFVIWIVSGGAQVSPQVSVAVQPHTPGANVCLMRIDFFQQR